MHEFAVQVVPLPQPLPIARQPFNPGWAIHSLGVFDTECRSCKALHWADEQLSGSSKKNPKFGTCCHQGKVVLPVLQPPPPELGNYYTGQDPISRKFRSLICKYNNALAFTSVGRQIDYSINDGGGPYVFKMHGELTHRIGSLLPAEGANPEVAYSQLYLYDPQTALDMRMGSRWNSGLSRDVLGTLQDMLYRHHPVAELYKHAQELMADIPDEDDCRNSLLYVR